HSPEPISLHLPLPPYLSFSTFFFFNDPATPEIYTLSLHDALPISSNCVAVLDPTQRGALTVQGGATLTATCPVTVNSSDSQGVRSEEHTSELQSLTNLVCRLLLEKKKQHTEKRHQRLNVQTSHTLA